jgi:hypothetical protein
MSSVPSIHRRLAAESLNFLRIAEQSCFYTKFISQLWIESLFKKTLPSWWLVATCKQPHPKPDFTPTAIAISTSRAFPIWTPPWIQGVKAGWFTHRQKGVQRFHCLGPVDLPIWLTNSEELLNRANFGSKKQLGEELAQRRSNSEKRRLSQSVFELLSCWSFTVFTHSCSGQCSHSIIELATLSVTQSALGQNQVLLITGCKRWIG